VKETKKKKIILRSLRINNPTKKDSENQRNNGKQRTISNDEKE